MTRDVADNLRMLSYLPLSLQLPPYLMVLLGTSAVQKHMPTLYLKEINVARPRICQY